MQGWIRSLLNSVVYPIKDKQWLAKSWPLPLMALIPGIALLSPIFYKGWRLSAVRQLAHAENTLPELDLFGFFRQGLLLWAFTFLYWLVPMAICAVFGIGIFGLVQDVGNIGSQVVQEWAVDQAKSSLWAILIYAVWVIISLPVYQAGMVRYAIGGSWRSMLNIPANFALFVRHARSFAMFYLSWVVITLCVALAGIFLSVTVIGVPLLPLFVLTAYYVTTAYELGHLARKISAADALVSGRSPVSTSI